MINNPTYATVSTAKRGAKRLGLTNFDIIPKGERFELRDLTSPLYDASKRARSAVKSPVLVVWDVCVEHGKTLARKDVVAMCVEMGVNINTARTQYQAWRAAEGLVKK